MGMVFQSYSLFPNLNVTDNVAFGLRTPWCRASRTAPAGSGRCWSWCSSTEFAGRYPHQLSGGQQQRVALARALAGSPTVLLLDEPLSALDAKVRLLLRDEIRRIQTELGITTLFVTHDQEEALGISDRVGVMSGGRLEQVGTPTEVYRNPASAFVARFVGSMNELAAMVTGPGQVEVAGLVVPTSAVGRFGTGEPVTLLVRPEDVDVTPLGEGNGGGADDAAGHGLTGSVVNLTFAGAATLVRVRVDRLDALITAHGTGTRADGMQPGARVAIRIDGAGRWPRQPTRLRRWP